MELFCFLFLSLISCLFHEKDVLHIMKKMIKKDIKFRTRTIRTFKIAAMIVVVFVTTVLNGCNNSALPKDTAESSTANINGYDTIEETVLQSSEATDERVENFLDTFTQTYPDFNLLDYVIGSDKNKPIKLAVIAENKKSGSSSTLFIVDDKGTGQVVLASDYFAAYRKEDGITLNENVISVSLDLNSSDTEYEIHDFEITVTQKEKEGRPDTVYASKETIRK